METYKLLYAFQMDAAPTVETDTCAVCLRKYAKFQVFQGLRFQAFRGREARDPQRKPRHLVFTPLMRACRATVKTSTRRSYQRILVDVIMTYR